MTFTLRDATFCSSTKFIFPIGYISFRIRLDSMLKLIWNYINPNGFAVYNLFATWNFVKVSKNISAFRDPLLSKSKSSSSCCSEKELMAGLGFSSKNCSISRANLAREVAG